MKTTLLRRLYPQNLRWQLIAGVAIVHAVMMSLFVWDLIKRQESILLDRQREQATTLAQTLAMSSAHWLVSHDLIGLRELIRAQKKSPEVVFALVTDRNHLILAHTEQEFVGMSLKGLPEQSELIVFSEKRQLVDVGAPVSIAGQHIGWVRVGIDSVYGNTKFQAIIESGIFYALAAIAIGAVMAWFLASKLITRLHTIQDTIGKVKAGARDCRIDLEGEDEAAHLAQEFNHALDTIFLRENQLENKKEELKELNRQLELLIEDRTRQLNESLMQTQKNERDLQMAQRVAKIGSWTLDIVENSLHCSKETLRIFGKERGEPFSLDQLINAAHPEDVQQVQEAWQGVRQGEDLDIEYRIVVDNQLFWIRVRAELCLGKDGSPLSAIGTINDITGKKRDEDRLRHLANIVASSQDGIVSKDLEGRITSWNHGAEELFGYAEEEAIGQAMHIIVPANFEEEEEAIIAKILMGESIVQKETIRKRRDGSMFDAAVTVSPLRNDQGELVATSEIIRDISKKKSNEQKLIQLTEKLTRSNDELEKFAYVASHDLKAPLRGIKNLAQWLSTDLQGEIDEKSERYLSLMTNRVERMEALLDGLLQYSRIGRIGTEVEMVDTRQLLEDTVQLLSVAEGFSVNVSADMPTFEAVKVPLEMVFRNLINNAIKHHDLETGRIDISVAEEEALYAFRVSDDGPGIGPEFHQKIFAIFQTLRPRDEVEGSGMGLALVKKAVEQQGGTITVHSNPEEERGSVFIFTWPKKPVVVV